MQIPVHPIDQATDTQTDITFLQNVCNLDTNTNKATLWLRSIDSCSAELAIN